jgi:hypothetical protein
VSGRLRKRETFVAASLVGAVVVVIGYASGFGVRPIFGAQPPPGGGRAIATNPPPVTTLPPASSTSVPAPAVAPNPAPRQVVPRAPAPAPPAAPQPVHPQPSAPITPTTPSTPPTPECQPGLLGPLLSTLGQVTDVLGVPLALPLTTALPVAGPLDPILAVCPPPQAPS